MDGKFRNSRQQGYSNGIANQGDEDEARNEESKARGEPRKEIQEEADKAEGRNKLA